MEFPDTGGQCNMKDCNLLDFLPVKCAHCNLIFCKDHAVTISHDCKEFKDNLVSERKIASSHKCNLEGCKSSDVVEMNCIICRKHFCLQHRHHGCLDAPPSLSKREKQRAMKEQFKQAKAETDKAVQDMLRNAKNRALANKIKLMKIKGSAVGDNQIPVKDRIFFLVAPPLQRKEKSCARGFFVNRIWTVGKSIDAFTKRLKVNNKNDVPDSPKLRLFSFDGNIITEDMTATMQYLLDTGALVDGDSLILEYVNQDAIDKNSYDDLFDEHKCSKVFLITLRKAIYAGSESVIAGEDLSVMSRETKWMCEYCTYENFPNASKCTMCRGAKPLSSEDIYRLRNSDDGAVGSGGGGGGTPSAIITADNLHEQLKPLRITDSELSKQSTHHHQPCSGGKWSCATCTYENWPKSRKCIMCGAAAPTVPSPVGRMSPSRSNLSIIPTSSPERDITVTRDNKSRVCSSRRNGEASTAGNNYEYERRRRQADWTWLRACQGVVEGDSVPVEAFLESGGDPTRQLTPSEVSLLNRPSAFDPGHTLVHLAIRFHREDMLAMLVSSIDGGGPGLKRVPSYVAPELASAIRRHAATIFNAKHSHSLPFPFITEFTTFVLPSEIEELPAAVQEQLFEELLDKDVQQQLESEPAVINWSVEITVQLGSRLHALWNRSQGDCLLDSLMQATWGVFDRDSLLRRALADSLTHGGHLLYPRWLESETRQARQLEFSLSEAQWAEDWSSLVARASQPGASLQQLHVFALAHVLRRPIIVYGVKFVKSFRGEDIGYAGFQGVYLPLLWEPSFCTSTPVALGYTRGHFSALVPIEQPYQTRSHDMGVSNNMARVCYLPLVDSEHKLLPIHFLTKAEIGSEEHLLRQWLDVTVTDGGLLVAKQRAQGRPLLVAQMLEEWLNHYRSLAQMSGTPYSRTIPAHDFSSDGDTDDE